MRELFTALKSSESSFIERPSTADWAACEDAIHSILPDDYKEMVSICGSGTFGLDLDVYNPGAKGAYRLSPALLEQHRSYHSDDPPLPLWPDRHGAITIGTTASEIDLLIRPRKGRWDTVVLDFAIGEFSVFPQSVPAFIWELFNNSVSDEIALRLREAVWPSAKTPLFIPAKVGTKTLPTSTLLAEPLHSEGDDISLEQRAEELRRMLEDE